MYYFQYHTANTDGASHGDDTSYVIGNHRSAVPAEAALSELMMNYWTNFAKTGDPNAKGLHNWPVFTDAALNTMIFDASSAAAPLPNMEKLKAFDSYYAWRRQQTKDRARMKSSRAPN